MKLPMKHRSLRLAVVASFAALLTLAAATPIAAQQAADSGATAADSGAAASGAQAGAASATAPGPRLPQWLPSFEPSLAERSNTLRLLAPAPAPAPANHTFVISTLALVIIVVIATILVVK
jgi:hypothetical protein